jgi:hypothetical protein
MSEQDATPTSGLALAEAIESLRDELRKARAADARSDIQLPIESMTVELSVTATRSPDGKARFTVPLAGLQLGGGEEGQQGSEQKVTVVFGPPVDSSGQPVKVSSSRGWDEGGRPLKG